LEAEVEGRIEGDDNFFRIAAVSLRYKFKIPKGKRVERIAPWPTMRTTARFT
jgi:hypothetical protein